MKKLKEIVLIILSVLGLAAVAVITLKKPEKSVATVEKELEHKLELVRLKRKAKRDVLANKVPKDIIEDYYDEKGLLQEEEISEVVTNAMIKYAGKYRKDTP